MRSIMLCGVALAGMMTALAQGPALQVLNPDSQYRLGPDSMPQQGVPKGEIQGPFTLPSKVYPGTLHTYWVYVPAQYDPAVPASLMVFQDGQAFKDPEGDLRAQNVLELARARFNLHFIANRKHIHEQPLGQPVPPDYIPRPRLTSGCETSHAVLHRHQPNLRHRRNQPPPLRLCE